MDEIERNLNCLERKIKDAKTDLDQLSIDFPGSKHLLEQNRNCLENYPDYLFDTASGSLKIRIDRVLKQKETTLQGYRVIFKNF